MTILNCGALAPVDFLRSDTAVSMTARETAPIIKGWDNACSVLDGEPCQQKGYLTAGRDQALAVKLRRWFLTFLYRFHLGLLR